jgi:hypothetical protein
MATKIPNGRMYDETNGYNMYKHLPSQDTTKFTQIGIFGLKIYHLATLATLASSIFYLVHPNENEFGKCQRRQTNIYQILIQG